MDEDSKQFAIALAKVAHDTRCQDIIALHVAPLASWTRFMVICTVMSKPQLMAVLAKMEKAASEEHKKEKRNVPGTSQWEVLDFGDVLAHIFTTEQRDYYDLEGFYAKAEEVDLPFLSGDAVPTQQWLRKA